MRPGIAALVHQIEAEDVRDLKLEPFRERTKSPLEMADDEWLQL